MYVNLLGYESYNCFAAAAAQTAAETDRMGKKHGRESERERETEGEREREKESSIDWDMQSSVQIAPACLTQHKGKLGSCQFGGA